MNGSRQFDELLGKLSLEEKIAQMMVFGVGGAMIDPWLWDFNRKYGLGGLRISPNGSRRFVRYLPDGAPGTENVNRPAQWKEKFVDTQVTPPFLSPEAYAEQLNEFRSIAFERRDLGLPMHMVTDCEACGGNFAPPWMMSMPHAMGFGDLGDLELLERAWKSMARQLKSIGIDWIHSPVVDVNVNPLNPEISARSFGADPDCVTRCAEANLRGLAAGNIIGTLKHYPGRGDSAQDAHFGLPVINASREDMLNIHIKPYRELIQRGMVEAIMLAHTVFPKLDASEEIATVSEFLTRDLLRGELRYQGVITTDSMTMGGLMARYSVSEAAIRAIQNGVDLILLKDENSLRQEMFDDLVKAVREKRLSESRIDESVLRIWKLKAAHGLFEKGGVVDPVQAGATVAAGEFRTIGREMARKVRRVMRMDANVLPLKPKDRIFVIDRVTDLQINRNDFWNYPGMIYDFLRKYTGNLTYCDYNGKNTARALKFAKQFQNEYDAIVVTTDFNRGDAENSSRKLVSDLCKLGKPVIQITSNPYAELIVPEESRNVIVTYGLMHEQFESVAAFLFGN